MYIDKIDLPVIGEIALEVVGVEKLRLSRLRLLVKVVPFLVDLGLVSLNLGVLLRMSRRQLLARLVKGSRERSL